MILATMFYLIFGMMFWSIAWATNFRYGTQWETFQGFLGVLVLWIIILIFFVLKGCWKIIRHEWRNA